MAARVALEDIGWQLTRLEQGVKLIPSARSEQSSWINLRGSGHRDRDRDRGRACSECDVGGPCDDCGLSDDRGWAGSGRWPDRVCVGLLSAVGMHFLGHRELWPARLVVYRFRNVQCGHLVYSGIRSEVLDVFKRV